MDNSQENTSIWKLNITQYVIKYEYLINYQINMSLSLMN